MDSNTLYRLLADPQAVLHEASAKEAGWNATLTPDTEVDNQPSKETNLSIEGHTNDWPSMEDNGPLWEDTGLVRLSDVQLERVLWLWPGRVPLGKLTILDGDPGLGKSLITADLAARVSLGAFMPDGSRGDLDGPAGVIFLALEDGIGDTLKPRITLAGADTRRVVIRKHVKDDQGVERPMEIPGDLHLLRRDIETVDAKLIVIDPIMGHLGGQTNSFRDQDIRRALTPLAQLAEETKVAVILIRHLNKAGGGSPIYRGGGSIAIIGVARSGLLVAKDPDDESELRRVLVPTKSNLSAPAPALAYTIESNSDGVPYVTWQGETSHTATRLLALPQDDEGRGSLGDARDFLSDMLRDGPQATKEVFREAKEAGISERTLKRAKTALEIVASREGYGRDGKWYWSLPAPIDKDSRREAEHISA